MPNYAVDLFCGVGGLTKGLELSGINVVAGIDFEPSCRFAYETNNHSHFINADITNLNSQDVLNLYPNDGIRILSGCAPCQPFSKYSLRYRKNGYQDEKWKLLYHFSRIIDDIHPNIIAMENVPELLHTKVFQDFRNHLQNMNYHTFVNIINCKNYGVPQNRKRLVFLASEFGDINLLAPTHDVTNYVTVRDAIGNLPPIKAGETSQDDIMHTSTHLSSTNLARIRASVPGGTWRDWPQELQLNCHKKTTGKSYPSVYGRMLWDEPSPTITTQFYGYGNGRFGHPEQNRAISLREGAILQSFPDDYIFVPENCRFNKRMLGIQIGNAVPVELGRIIGISILNHLEENRNE